MDEPCSRPSRLSLPRKVSNANVRETVAKLAGSTFGTALVMSGRPPTPATGGSLVHSAVPQQQQVAGSDVAGVVATKGDAVAATEAAAAAPAAGLRASGLARAAKRPLVQLSDDSSWDDDDDVPPAEPKRHKGVAAAKPRGVSHSDSDASYAEGASRRKQQRAAAAKAKKSVAAPKKSGGAAKKSGGAAKAPAVSKRARKSGAAAAAAVQTAGGEAEPAAGADLVKPQAPVAPGGAAVEHRSETGPPAAAAVAPAASAPAAAAIVDEEEEEEAPAPSIRTKNPKPAAAPTRVPLAPANQPCNAAVPTFKLPRRPGGNMRNNPIQPQVKARVAGLRRKK